MQRSSISFIHMYIQEGINRYFIPLLTTACLHMTQTVLYLAFFSTKLPVSSLNAELMGFSERLNPGYERKRKMKDDSKLLELGLVAFWIITCSAFASLRRSQPDGQLLVLGTHI